MPDIEAFRGIRYNVPKIGALADLVAPPYDVISPRQQDQLYERHPANVVRLILNRQRASDDDERDNRYTRAAEHLRGWREQGTLIEEDEPALYVYHQVFDYAGQTFTRRGFMARMRLSPFGSGQVFPHEQTMPGPKMDRLMLMTTCRANLSQIFGLYPDPSNAAQAVLEESLGDAEPLESVDDLGVTHRMWPVTDQDAIARVADMLAERPVFVADGHHRYETACEYREHVRQVGGLTPDHPANFVMTMLIAMEDPGLIVLPTHRLFSGATPLTAEELSAKLGDCFTCNIAAEGAKMADEVWRQIERENDQGLIGLYTAADQQWTLCRVTDLGRARLDGIAGDHNPEWRALGVSILHRLLIEDRLGQTELPKPKYVHLVEEVVEGLGSGDYPLAALVMPATVDDVRTLSLMGERMPAKSTYFYPKLLSGLVINPLE